jgi:hypothetical protein
VWVLFLANGITNKTNKNLNDEAIKKITNITNAIIKQEHYPETWKKPKTIMILKPGKLRKETKNYRPISLLPSSSNITAENNYRRLKQEIKEKEILVHTTIQTIWI